MSARQRNKRAKRHEALRRRFCTHDPKYLEDVKELDSGLQSQTCLNCSLTITVDKDGAIIDERYSEYKPTGNYDDNYGSG